MINGSHIIVFSKKPEADVAFLKDVLGLAYVDAGGGRLFFALPPSEVGVHESKKNSVHELYLTCDDVNAFVSAVGEHGVRCDAVQDQGWGLLTAVTLPGGGKLGVYEPRHVRAHGKASPLKSSRAKTKTKAKAKAPRAVQKKAAPKRAALAAPKKAKRAAKPARR